MIGYVDGVTKYKPQRSPRLLEMQSSQEHDEQKKTLQKARNAVSRSGELIKKSKEIVASSQSLSAEASNLSLAKKMPPPVKFPDCFFSQWRRNRHEAFLFQFNGNISAFQNQLAQDLGLLHFSLAPLLVMRDHARGANLLIAVNDLPQKSE